MVLNKFKGKRLVIQESKFITTFFNNTHFSCGLCNLIFNNDCAVIFHPINKIGIIFGNHHFCKKCALGYGRR